MDTNALFHIARDGQRTGPLTFAQLSAFWGSGAVGPETLYWQDGMANWEPLSTAAGELPARGSVPSAEVVTSVPASVSSASSSGPQCTSKLAVWSLILGLLSFVFSLITGVPAIVCGHVARGKIKQSGHRLTGEGIALAGLVLGYLSIALIPILGILAAIAIPAFVSARDRGLGLADLNHLRQIALQAQVYCAEHENHLPTNIEELVPKYVGQGGLVSPLKRDEPTGYELLQPGVAMETIPNASALPILRGKFTAGHRRAIIYADMHGDLERE